MFFTTLTLLAGCAGDEPSLPPPPAPTAETAQTIGELEVVPDASVLRVRPGEAVLVDFSLERTDYAGPVEVELEDLPLGLVGDIAEVPANGDVGTVTLEAVGGVPVGTARIARLVATGAWTTAPEPAEARVVVYVGGRAGDPVFADGDRIEHEVVPGVHATRDLAVDRWGRMLAVGSTGDVGWALRFGVDGRPDETFGDAGRIDLGAATPRHVVVRPDDGVVVDGDGAGSPLLRAFDETGAPDLAFGDAGSVQVEADGPAVELLWAEAGPVLATPGALLAYGVDGVSRFAVAPDGLTVTSAALTPTGDVLIGGSTADGGWAVERRAIGDGARDDGFAGAWHAPRPKDVVAGTSRVFGLAADPLGGLALAEVMPKGGKELQYHAIRFAGSGALVPAFDEDGVVALTDIAAFGPADVLALDDTHLLVGRRTDGVDGRIVEVLADGRQRSVAWGIDGIATAIAVDDLGRRVFVVIDQPGYVLIQGFWL